MAWIFLNLGNIYRNLDNYEKAKILLKKSYIVYKKIYGSKHIETARVLKELGEVYLAENQMKAAETLIMTALKISQESKHPDEYAFLESLAELYFKKSIQAMKKKDIQQSQKFKDQAIFYLRQALKTAVNNFSENSYHIRKIQCKLTPIALKKR